MSARDLMADVLREFLRRQHRKELLRDMVLAEFEPSPQGKVKRMRVYECVARRLRRSVSNTLCLEVKAAIEEIEGVHEFMSNGRSWFRGLRPRPPMEPVLPVDHGKQEEGG